MKNFLTALFLLSMLTSSAFVSELLAIRKQGVFSSDGTVTETLS